MGGMSKGICLEWTEHSAPAAHDLRELKHFTELLKYLRVGLGQFSC